VQDLVPLSADHPGFQDAAYRGRRNAIARIALEYRGDRPVPEVAYTPSEQGVWRTIWRELSPLHQRFAAREYLEAQGALRLPIDVIPQLSWVNRQLENSTGFKMHPVAGLVTARGFLSRLGDDVFLSTQYMRHPSVPLYTPEPDVVHELVGHAATLAHPLFAELNRAFGLATARANDEDLKAIERVYWYSLEFGVAREASGLKAYGAGLLSSFGELERIQGQARLLPWNVEQVAAAPYDPTRYQDTLFVAEQGFTPLAKDLLKWLSKWTG
jgi:phenylalanine-4-hydroxylase